MAHLDESRAGRDGEQLVVIANRLPVRRVAPEERAADAEGEWAPSPGGLASALTPLLVGSGAWVGSVGQAGPVPDPFELDGIALFPVPVSETELEGYYDGLANQTLWPLYHDAIRPPVFHRAWWASYRAVNERFAAAAAEVAGPDAIVWVHDYHLHLVPAMLRARRPDLRIGFFLHIPFPPIELFAQLPWRRELIEGTLGADVIGFQVAGGAANFGRLARRFAGTAGRLPELEVGDRRVHVGAYPISIDTASWEARAALPGVTARAAEIRGALGHPRHLLLGIDRLDYTKGIELRLRAFRELLEDGVLDATETVLVQVATPSREGTRHYEEERHRIERLVGEINGDHGAMGRPVVQYVHQSQPVEELTALYRAADVMLVTPLRDGMNLVAKEYVASRLDQSGALVLSEFTGAANELRDALLVNPHDIAGVKHAVVRAIHLGHAEQRRRMRRLRAVVRRADVHVWAEGFLSRLRAPGVHRPPAAAPPPPQ